MPTSFTVAGLAPTHDPLWARPRPSRRGRSTCAPPRNRAHRMGPADLGGAGQGRAALRPAEGVHHQASPLGHGPRGSPCPGPPAGARAVADPVAGGRPGQGGVDRGLLEIRPGHGEAVGRDPGLPRRGGRAACPSATCSASRPTPTAGPARGACSGGPATRGGCRSVMPRRPRPGKRGRPPGAVQPGYVPGTPPPPHVGPSRTDDLSIGADIYTMSKGAAATLIDAMRKGKFTGFRTYGAPPGRRPRPGPCRGRGRRRRPGRRPGRSRSPTATPSAPWTTSSPTPSPGDTR
jgi:hypothetical protein